jgi:hypothetical protein
MMLVLPVYIIFNLSPSSNNHQPRKQLYPSYLSIIYTFNLMVDSFIELKDWLIDLGEDHNVNPFVFGGLYLTGKLLLLSFLARALKFFRSKKPILMPLAAAATGFSLPYIYLVIAGRNLSIWIYILIGAIFILGAFSIWKKITAKERPADVSAGS